MSAIVQHSRGLVDTVAHYAFNRERDEQGRWRKGTWSQGYTGTRFWPIDPRADEIRYDDMCIGLARAFRYRGQTREAYSVAEHSVIVSLYVEQFARERGYVESIVTRAAQQALLHDAPEAWIGDVARPLKYQRAMRAYRKLEKKWERAVFEHFGIAPMPCIDELIGEVDNRIVLDEIEALFIDPDMWPRSGRYIGVEPLGADIAAMTWEQSAAAFSQRFAEMFVDYP